MKKKLISSLLMGAFVVASTSMFVSCKDYDDDISSLRTQIGQNDAAIKALQSLSGSGWSISGVTKTSDGNGIVISGKDEKGTAFSYTITNGKDGVNGTNGTNGTNAVIWTIGADGFWYQDGVKTNYKAVGQDGKDGNSAEWTIGADGYWYKDGKKTDYKAVGEDGKPGTNGTNGINGKDADIWTPGDDGYWLKNGEKTDQKWEAEGAVTAVYGEKNIRLSGVAGFEGEIILSIVSELKGLVFIPKTYYWGIEATTVKTLVINPWYKDLKDLTTYIDEYKNRTEVIGTKRPLSPENNILDYQVKDGIAHERYNVGTNPATYTVTLKASADYHINPSNAHFDDKTSVDVLSYNKDYTRAKGTATVSFKGNKSGADHSWTVDKAKGTLNVPLAITGTVGTVVNTAVDNKNSGVTVFATQVSTSDTTVTSDYAALIQENVKDLKLAHVRVKFNPTTHKVDYSEEGRISNTQLSETGMLNKHCGECDLAEYLTATFNNNRGMHLFESVDEVKDYINATVRVDGRGVGEGWDTTPFDKDIDLNNLVETHYTNTMEQHDRFNDEDFARNFRYEFELTSIRLGGNETDESAHAAIYKDESTGHYFLHPQDPQVGGVNGRPYDPAKATEVVVNRVPVVRVKLIYNEQNVVVDYGYLPIRITKEETTIVRPTIIVDNDHYKATKNHDVVFYNKCWTTGGANEEIARSDWRNTEEDLFSNAGLPYVMHRQEFDDIYRVEPINGGVSTAGDCPIAQQYILKINGNDTTFVKVDDPHTATLKDDVFGNIRYTETTGDGHLTSIFIWDVTKDEIQDFATANPKATENDGTVVRAVRLYAKDGNVSEYPDIYVVFHSGVLSLKNYTVKGDAEITKHIIEKYWYKSGTTELGTAEIHTNVITPEENLNNRNDQSHDGWKPRDMANTFSNVFLNNFRTIGTTNHQPKNWIKFLVFDGDTQVSQSAPNPPFNTTNIDVDFLFEINDANKFAYGHLDNGDPKKFAIRIAPTAQTITLRDGSSVTYPVGKVLQAKQADKPDTDYQNICTIDEWDLTTFAALQDMKISLIWESQYAKSLLNFKSHRELKTAPTDSVFHATVAIKAVVKDGQKELKYQAGATADPIYCSLDLINNKFDVRFLRPISLGTKEPEPFVDAHASGDMIQSIPLEKIVSGFTDWRNQWKASPDYELYYSPVNEKKIKVTLDGVNPGDNLAVNRNVKTDLNGNIQNLYQVSNQLQMTLNSAGDAIEYLNLASTVNEFHVWIPVAVEYYWGTYYASVRITVKKTLDNSRKN